MRSFITKHALLLLLLHGAKQEDGEAGRQGQEEEGGGEGGREKRSCLLLSGSLVEVGEEPLGFPVHWTTDLGLEFGPRPATSGRQLTVFDFLEPAAMEPRHSKALQDQELKETTTTTKTRRTGNRPADLTSCSPGAARSRGATCPLKRTRRRATSRSQRSPRPAWPRGGKVVPRQRGRRTWTRASCCSSYPTCCSASSSALRCPATAPPSGPLPPRFRFRSTSRSAGPPCPVCTAATPWPGRAAATRTPTSVQTRSATMLRPSPANCVPLRPRRTQLSSRLRSRGGPPLRPTWLQTRRPWQGRGTTARACSRCPSIPATIAGNLPAGPGAKPGAKKPQVSPWPPPPPPETAQRSSARTGRACAGSGEPASPRAPCPK